jgi:hypothetical protein
MYLETAPRRWDAAPGFLGGVVNCLASGAANGHIGQTSLARPHFALGFEVT